MEVRVYLTYLMKNLYADQEATVRTGHGKTDWFNIGKKKKKKYNKAVYCHSAYLTCIQSTSCEILGWMNHKLASILPGEIEIDRNSMEVSSNEKGTYWFI